MKKNNGLAKEILNKIEANLSQQVLSLEEYVRCKQISEQNYQTITTAVENSSFFTGFCKQTKWDSKWLFKTDSFNMGIRKEWQNPEGVVIGLDICRFDNQTNTLTAVGFKEENHTSQYICLIIWILYITC